MSYSRSKAFALLLAASLLLLLPGCDWTVQIGDPGTPGPLGDAIDHPGDWAWAPVEGAKCRDGSDTGFGARLRERSSNLLIYLEGGGACFNEETCRENQARFGRLTFEGIIVSGRGDEGIFNTSRSENPFAGWNAAYVPYCTGDVHAGSASGARVEGVDADSDGRTDRQQFVGHHNIQRDLGILAERYAGTLNQVVLAGSSAGGFGTLVNYEAAQAAFPGARVTLLDDSGPPVAASDVLSPQLEARWIDLWNIEQTLSTDTRAAVQSSGLSALYESYTDRFPDQSFGLLSYLRDGVIRNFYGYRHPGCDVPTDECVTGDEYAQALAEVRDQEAPGWATYYAEGTDHTFLADPRFYDTSVNGTPLTEWTSALLDGNVLDGNVLDVAPAPQ